ncbi:response regulator [Paenibacillus swuensis]|uniref:Response regulator n=1 Tax=Paenibacillus swuensis TaxID=1178515 RepID=A0A172TMX1_9BACL|nr:fused response regulator/phosphatase [Paenibacillus swuensis]ANE48113.1 response regulator [Paenibacillus swuensis]
MSIMIVDDNPTNLIIIKEILKKAGYRDLITAPSAQVMFELLEQEEVKGTSPFHLILLDIMMPDMDGIEACRRLQLLPALKDIPVIMVTALGDSNKLAEALDAGAIDYVTKPINRVELLARIRVALRLKHEKDWHKERDDHMRNELQLAKQVQTGVLTPTLLEDHIHIQAIYQPSAVLAGDLYAWYPIDEHRRGIILLDVMGHGISSSLVSMFVASLLRDIITTMITPQKVIQELNRRMNQLYVPGSFVQYYFTAIYLVVDTKNRTIQYANAGHPAGLMLEEQGRSRPLDKGACAIGFFDSIEVHTQTVEYNEECRIVLYTDGLSDHLVQEDEELFPAMVSKLAPYQKSDLNTIHQHFFEGQEIQDDMCIVIIDIKP